MTCSVSRAKTLAIAAACFSFAGLGYFSATHSLDHPPWFGWLTGGFFGLMGLGVIARLMRGATVTLDEAGIYDSRWRLDALPWAAIRKVTFVSVAGTRLLGIDLRDEERYLSGLSPFAKRSIALNLATGLPALSISFVGLSPGISQAWDYVATYHPELMIEDGVA